MAVGADLVVNHKTGLAQATRNGTKIIVPLGAASLKVGSDDRELFEPVFQWS